jgi:hypothetical protein
MDNKALTPEKSCDAVSLSRLDNAIDNADDNYGWFNVYSSLIA